MFSQILASLFCSYQSTATAAISGDTGNCFLGASVGVLGGLGGARTAPDVGPPAIDRVLTMASIRSFSSRGGDVEFPKVTAATTEGDGSGGLGATGGIEGFFTFSVHFFKGTSWPLLQTTASCLKLLHKLRWRIPSKVTR
ncbi:hypothetical protein ABZP36_013923 [Zizania latifolia]